MKIFPKLQHLFFQSEHGKEILRCIQCGTCSGSCPFTDQMDYAPRGLFALIKNGEMAKVLNSNTPWFCSSCYQCVERCPQEILVTDIMYTLKQMALEYGTVPQGYKMPDLYEAFETNLKTFGRVTEHVVMAQYSIKHPLDAINSMPLAMKLLGKKRVGIKPQMTADRKTINKLLDEKLINHKKE